ncbi:MAG: hypothetical protein FWF98_04665 [Dehalococcoidia bacterium]|nr:hypothetical protein [Dehalococcoidia bacterium]
MKKGALSFLAACALCMVLLVAACDGGDGGSKTSSENPGGTASTGNTNTNDYPLMKETGGPVKGHSAADLDGGACLTCHGKNDSKRSQTRVPTPSSWYSYAQTEVKGTDQWFTVQAGSKADHTSYTNSQCYDSGCHTKP